MAGHAYNVPVILPDLRKEESYRQIVDALEYLDAVSNDIFNRITCRIVENREQLVTLNGRIFTAQAKIDKLRSTSTKATQVFSSPKYPAPKHVADYQTIFHEVDPALLKVRKIKDPIESRLVEVSMEVLKNKNKPYRLNLRRQRSRQERATMDDPEMGEGLGSLPKNLPSVSSLLLFNTTENPYKKYVLRDPLEGAKTKTRDNMAEEEEKLHDAPETITHGEQMDRGQRDSLMYVPLMPELPELDVPDSLPSLQYVASDMYYQGDAGASIAPSVASLIPELPSLADPDASVTQDTPKLPPPVEDTSGPPPPPPPPPPAPVAAPPLPTVREDAEGDSSDDEAGPPPDQGDDDGDGDRSNLMDAIRKAGGASQANLKNSKDRKMERKAKKEDITDSGGGGDLLGDLSAALGRRRKAMSGKDKENRREKKEEHSLGGGSMLDKMSNMIPTLKVAEGAKEDSDDGEGWTA